MRTNIEKEILRQLISNDYPIVINGRSQAVRLPKECQFKGDDVYIQKTGDAVILFPADKQWETFLHGLNSFSDDFLSRGRDQGQDQTRKEL